MASHEMLSRITGDPVWADRTEDLAFNSLPAALDPKQTGIHYVTSANSIAQLNRTGSQGQFQNGFPMQAYMLGIDNYRCCPHNYGMGWPYYVEEMWAATPDDGLGATLHGPSRVTAKVADGTTVTITADTAYPFTDTITFTRHHARSRWPSRCTCGSRAGAPVPRSRSTAPRRRRPAARRTPRSRAPGPTATGSCSACPCRPAPAPGPATTTRSRSTSAR